MRAPCPECGASLDEDVTACPRCAGTLQDVECCPACKGPLPSEADCCPACGSPLFAEEDDVPGGPPRIGVSRKLMTVFSGPRETALALQAALAGAGCHVQIADHNTRNLDPRAPGGNVFGFDLQAPFEEAETARKSVAELRAKAAAGARRDWAPPLSDEGRSRLALEDLGRRIRWSSCLEVTVPYSLWLGLGYVPAAMRMRPRPGGHVLTLGALFMAALLTVAGLLLLRHVVAGAPLIPG